MSLPQNNNIAAVATDQFHYSHLPRLQLVLRLLLAGSALAYAARSPALPLFPFPPYAVCLAGYGIVQGILTLLMTLRGARPWLSATVAGLDLLAGLAIAGNDPAPGAPSLLILLALLGLGAGQLRWLSQLIYSGIALALAATMLVARQPLLHLGYDYHFYMLLLLLSAAVLALLWLAHLVEHMRERSARITDLDPLTGLGNRWTFYEAAKYLLPYHQRNLIPMVVMFADIELQKGASKLPRNSLDQLIKQFAIISEQRLRSSDVAVHYGYSTFAYLLIDTTTKDAEAIANDLQEEFDRWAAASQLPAQAHVGLASVPDHAVALDQILININSALQRSRQYKRGVGGAVFADPEQQS